MVTLKELVTNNQYIKNDLDIIKEYFIVNDLELDGISMLTELAQSKYNKVNERLDIAKYWIPNKPNMRVVNKRLTSEQQHYINSITDLCILDLDLTQYKDCYEWAQKNIPSIRLPKCIFTSVIQYLNRYGIRFKE